MFLGFLRVISSPANQALAGLNAGQDSPRDGNR